MEYGVARWSGDRFLIIEGKPGQEDNSRKLCIVDVEAKVMLLNNNFEALVRGPRVNVWAAIRFRGVGRHQFDLTDDFCDTLFVIDLPRVVKAASMAGPTAPPFSHLQSITLPGYALAKPVWLNVPPIDTLIVGLWNGKEIEETTINPATFQIVGRRPLNISMEEESVHRAWMEKRTENEVIEAMGILPR